MSRYLLALTLGLGYLTICQRSLGADELFQTAVFESGKEGYHTFRIPSLLTTHNGTLLAFCEGRTTGRGDHGDIDLVVKRSADQGTTWSDVEIVYEEGGTKKVTIGNACPVIDEVTGTIWLTFCRDNKNVLVTSSADDGKTWSNPIDISKDVTLAEWSWVATGPGVGIQLTKGEKQGRLVIPCDHGIQPLWASAQTSSRLPQRVSARRALFSRAWLRDRAVRCTCTGEIRYLDD